MTRTTPPPSRNVLDVLPELTVHAKTTIRLHPRRGAVSELSASKIGGMFLWPQDEPWPQCDESHSAQELGMFSDSPDPWSDSEGLHGPLVPVVQLRQVDFPEIEYYPGTDLFQLLWCPIDHSSPIFVAKSFAFWRKEASVIIPLSNAPEPVLAEMSYVPNECRITPERVQEFPTAMDLSPEMVARLEEWDWPDEPDDEFDETQAADDNVRQYEYELSACPSCKVGGHVAWTQSPRVPTCMCGARMEHLLTISDTECDGGTYLRWLPVEDRRVWDAVTAEDGRRREAVISAIGLDRFVGGRLFVFICRKCGNWPIQTVYQR